MTTPSERGYRRPLLLTALCVAALIACSQPEPRGRVLLIGIDGATFRIARPLLAEGKLPNLAEIARQGVSGPLRSELPLISPRIWNTIATGKAPKKHGINTFAHEDGEGRYRLLLSSDRKTHALWNIASDAGLRVGVVNWWNTYPPEKIEGVMVSDHLLASQLEGRRLMARAEDAPTGPLVFPESWYERVSVLLERDEALTRFENPFRSDQRIFRPIASDREGRDLVGDDLAPYFDDDGNWVRIGMEIASALRPDLLMVMLPGVDRISHFLWGSIESPELYPPGTRPSAEERAAGAEVLRLYYQYIDALVGMLAGTFDEDDLVMVVSDHGFEAGVVYEGLTGVHESEKAIEGILFARGRGIPRGRPAGPVSVNDVTPTILAWWGFPRADDMDGKPAAFLAASTSSETIATYDTTPIERLATAPSGVEDEIVEDLKALGYLE